MIRLRWGLYIEHASWGLDSDSSLVTLVYFLKSYDAVLNFPISPDELLCPFYPQYDIVVPWGMRGIGLAICDCIYLLIYLIYYLLIVMQLTIRRANILFVILVPKVCWWGDDYCWPCPENSDNGAESWL